VSSEQRPTPKRSPKPLNARSAPKRLRQQALNPRSAPTPKRSPKPLNARSAPKRLRQQALNARSAPRLSGALNP